MYCFPMATSKVTIASVARTVLKVCGAKGKGLEPAAAAADARVAALAPAGGVKKLLIYAPDAIGSAVIARFPAIFSRLGPDGFNGIPLRSVFPSKTPVCFASMFSGLAPAAHGITQYEKPVLKCRTIFDALPACGLRTAIVAVKNSSIDLIFKGRQVDYYSEKYDGEATARALALIAAGGHDVILVYHQEYDDTLHASNPWNAKARAALRRHMRSFEELSAAFDKKWQALPRALFFAPDHGAHIDPATGKGTHGADIPADMEINHFWKFSPGKAAMRQVTAAVMVKGGKILIAQRKRGDALAGKWEFPGGKLEAGETPEACLRRELAEEFGVDTKIGAFICSSRFEYKHLPIELLAYKVKHLSGKFKLNDHDRIEWVKPAELPEYDFCSADLPVVERLLGKAAAKKL